MDIYKDGVKVDVTGIINNSDGVINDVIDACCLINKKIYENPDSGKGWDWTSYDDSGESQAEIITDDFQLGDKTVNAKTLWGRPDCSGLTWMIGQLMGYYFGSACAHIFKFIEEYANEETGDFARLITPEYNPRDWKGKEKSVTQWLGLPYTSDWELIVPANGHNFASDGEGLKPGDLILKQGHIQIFGCISNDKLYVWNWGDDEPIRRTRDACMQILNEGLTGDDRVQALINHNCEYSWLSHDDITLYNYGLRFKGFTNSQIMKYYWMDEEGNAKGNYRNPIIRVKQVKGGDNEHVFNTYQSAANYLRTALEQHPAGTTTERYYSQPTIGPGYWTDVDVKTTEPDCMYELIIEDGGDAIEIPSVDSHNSLCGFANLDNIRSLKITGPGVLRIGNNAFAGCGFLQSVIIGDDTEWIGHQAFAVCSRLSSIDFKNVKIIGEAAFVYTHSLTSITIPDTCKLVYPTAFCAPYTSKDSYPPSPTSYNYIMYYKYTPERLTTVNLGNGLNKISNAMFVGRAELTSVTIGSGVREILPYAFGYCQKLETVTFEEGCENIAYRAFEYCPALTTITLPESIQHMGDFDTTFQHWQQAYTDVSGINHASGYYDTPYHGTSIDQSSNMQVFEECYNLTTINCKNHNLTKGAPWGATNATVNYL